MSASATVLNDCWAPRKISPYGGMTGVRVRSAVDRSILGLSPRLPEVATGFSGCGLIGSTHATQRVARRFTRPRPPSFQDKRSGACCSRGSSFRFCTARERCRWCARVRLPCRSFDHQIHARRGREFEIPSRILGTWSIWQCDGAIWISSRPPRGEQVIFSRY